MAFIQSRLVWYVAGTLLLTVVLLATGCASAPHSREERVASHVYHAPLNKLRSLALVDSIMNDSDVTVSAIKKTSNNLEDVELDDLSSAFDTQDRFTVERKDLVYVGRRVGRDQFKIEIYERDGEKRVRQPALEWEFLKKNDPGAAIQIERASN